MRRGLVLPFALVLSLALAAGLTELYDGLEAALGQVRLENPAQAVNALNRAQSLLREEGALPPVLRDAALTNLQEARQFVAQKSAVDLEARLLLVRHLVGKALYDAFLQAQGEEKAALGQRLARAGLERHRVVVDRRRERMVHRGPALRVGIPLEHREVDDP